MPGRRGKLADAAEASGQYFLQQGQHRSIAGLVGLLTRHPTLPDPLPWWVLAVIAGGLIGASFGARRLDNRAMRRALAAVLLIAGAKMIV